MTGIRIGNTAVMAIFMTFRQDCGSGSDPQGKTGFGSAQHNKIPPYFIQQKVNIIEERLLYKTLFLSEFDPFQNTDPERLNGSTTLGVVKLFLCKILNQNRHIELFQPPIIFFNGSGS